jgi:hypothetical protein
MKFDAILFACFAAIATSSFNIGLQASSDGTFQPSFSIGQSANANEGGKMNEGAIVVIRNQTLNQPLNLRQTSNGTKINGSPSHLPIDSDQQITIRRKSGTNIVQFEINGKVVSVKGKGINGEWLEVWDKIGYFDPLQSFYYDTLPNGNLIFSSVKFPGMSINLKFGGTKETYAPYMLWDKKDINSDTDRQFKVDVVGKANNAVQQNQLISNPKVSDISIYGSGVQVQNPRLPGGSESRSLGGQQKVICFIFGRQIPVPLVPGFACNQLLTNAANGSYFILPNQLPFSWEQSAQMCNTFGGKLEWSYDKKTCFSK